MTNKKTTCTKNIKKNIFNEYWNDEELRKGFENGLLKGAIRLNPRNYKEAYVTHTKRDSDILVYDKDINRALYDDIVAINIHSKYDWKVLPEICNEQMNIINLMSFMSLQNDGRKTDNTNNGCFVTIRMLLSNFPNIFTDKLGWDMSNVDLSNNDDFPSTCKDWWKYFQRTGYVVSILQQMNSRYCVGTLSLPENAKSFSFVKFIPSDIRYPRLVLSLKDCPGDFFKRPQDYNDVKFIAEIGTWNAKDMNPKGHINQCLKDLSMIDQETIKILAECGFNGSEFSESVIKSIPKDVITSADLKYRRDIRQECVFSIDPKTARDLDDALHIKELPSEAGVRMWEVGVHIADVSYYVTGDSEIDCEAGSRTTTVYMVHRAVPMLPRQLCEHLCSLHPGTDKLAYSVIYRVSDDGQVRDTWIGRTIIRSACKLSYEEAQSVLDNAAKSDWTPADIGGEIFGPFTAAHVARSIGSLNHLAVQMRERRFQNGSLWLNQPKIGFILNEDRNIPLGYKTYKLGASNHLIEEWMLQANISVAEFLHENMPKTAFLRCHPSPTVQAIENINKQFEQMGWKDLRLVTGSTEEFQALMKSFDKEGRDRTMLTNICSKAMQLALYFCNNNDDRSCLDNCHHFALNVPLYTHFTSPIRRYPDVIVHRQITDVLIKQLIDHQQSDHEGDDVSGRLEWMARTMTSASCTISRLCYLGDYCNKKKKDAKSADDSSIVLFYSLFVEKSGPFTETGTVMGLLDKAFDVFLNHCGFVRRVYLDQMNTRQTSFNRKQYKLSMTWSRDPSCAEQGHPEIVTDLSLMTEVKVILSTIAQGENSAPKLKLVLMRPVCEHCQVTAAGAIDCGDDGTETMYRDISTMQLGSDQSIVDDEDCLYSVLDDI